MSKKSDAACPNCKGGTCSNCKTYLRIFRMCVRRAAVQPAFLMQMRLTGEFRSEPTDKSPDGRILEGALPLDKSTERVLMSVARSVQGEQEPPPKKLKVGGDGPELLKKRFGGGR